MLFNAVLKRNGAIKRLLKHELNSRFMSQVSHVQRKSKLESARTKPSSQMYLLAWIAFPGAAGIRASSLPWERPGYWMAWRSPWSARFPAFWKVRADRRSPIRRLPWQPRSIWCRVSRYASAIPFGYLTDRLRSASSFFWSPWLRIHSPPSPVHSPTSSGFAISRSPSRVVGLAENTPPLTRLWMA